MAYSTLAYKQMANQAGNANRFALVVQTETTYAYTSGTATIAARLLMLCTLSYGTTPYYGFTSPASLSIGGTSVFSNTSTKIPNVASEWSNAYAMTVNGTTYNQGVYVGGGSQTYSLSSSTQSKAVAGSYGIGSNTATYLPPTGTHSASGNVSLSAVGSPSISSVTTTPSRTGCSFSISGSAGTNGGNATYLTTCNSTSASGTSPSFSSLSPNTAYNYTTKVTNSSGLTASYSSSFWTTANAPTIGTPTAAPTRNGCTITCTATADTNVSISSYTTYYRVNGTSTYSSTSGKVMSALAGNTTYQYYVRATDSLNKTVDTSVYTFTTTGNNPVVTDVTAATTRTGCVLTPTVSYDVNASYQTCIIDYGTTTSYGYKSYGNLTLTGLSPNTTYYYSMEIWDNFNRISALYLGSFKTTGNIPVINSASSSSVTTNSSTMTYNVTYDTNASYASHKWEYGTTTSYGSSVSNTNSITGLAANTTYYWRLTVTDNHGYTSSGYTGSFITNPATVQINSVEITDVDFTSFTAKISFPTPTLVNRIESTLYLEDGTTVVQTQTITTGITSPTEILFENLTSGSGYVLKTRIRTVRSNAYSTIVTSYLSIADARFLKVIDESGDFYLKTAYGIGKANIFYKDVEYTGGGMTFVSGGTPTACINAFVGTQGYNYIMTTKPIAVLPSTSYTFTCDNHNVQFTIIEFNGLSAVAQVLNASDTRTWNTNANATNVYIVLRSVEPLNPAVAKGITNELYKTDQIKPLISNDVVKISDKIRYIDIGQAGNSLNTGNHIVALEVYDVNGTNIALNKPVSAIHGLEDTSYPLSRITNGNISSSNYAQILHETPTDHIAIVRVDLGREYDVSNIKLWRHYSDNRMYHKTYCYGRRSNGELCWKFHEYKKDGPYVETSAGYSSFITYEMWDTVPVIEKIILDTEAGIPNIVGTLINVTAVEAIPPIPVIDRLDSIRTDAFLSANQGRLLNIYIGKLDSLTTQAKENIVAAINELYADFTGKSGYNNIIEAILEAPFIK